MGVSWQKALIGTTIVSYGTAIVATAAGHPPLADIAPNVQMLQYATVGGLLSLHLLFPGNKWLRYGIMGFYGMAAGLSFSGLQKWNWDGVPQPILGPAMAAWDLALAVAVGSD